MSYSCCESPQQEFTIRNNDDAPLVSGKPAKVTLPSGIIDIEGMKEIRTYLLAKSYTDENLKLRELAYSVEDVGPEWQTSSGNFTKRLSSHAHKAHKVKIPPDALSQIGCIARDHSEPVDVFIEVTRNLNRGSAYFGNAGSCWWDSYRESRCALKTNGGFGLRSFDAYGDVTGRAWVMPLRLTMEGLSPTFDTMHPGAFVTFNGYGAMSSYSAPRIMAYLAGWTYSKIEFSCRPMYVNGSTGYLAAPEPVIKSVSRRGSTLHLSLDQHASLFEAEQAMENERDEASV